jgi:hypothetical protein
MAAEQQSQQDEIEPADRGLVLLTLFVFVFGGLFTLAVVFLVDLVMGSMMM